MRRDVALDDYPAHRSSLRVAAWGRAASPDRGRTPLSTVKVGAVFVVGIVFDAATYSLVCSFARDTPGLNTPQPLVIEPGSTRLGVRGMDLSSIPRPLFCLDITPADQGAPHPCVAHYLHAGMGLLHKGTGHGHFRRDALITRRPSPRSGQSRDAVQKEHQR
jgi:hypothetical protein